ncbi:MAG: alpha-L-fucosidase, partial [Candidatus Omnitrophica bacterium]|nr:alpha-L-fucosidase [Candidatus Omnitrophota bacterium]
MENIRIPKGDWVWFYKARFGLFIHWGLYSLPARHEWVRSFEEIPDEIYDEKYFGRFEPDLYDPSEWAKLAKKAGMKYVVI